MPRNLTTGIFTRVSNSFSNPVYGTVIDPTDADSLFDDYDGGLTFNDAEPLILVGSTSGVLTILAPDTASGTITLPAGTTDFSATGGAGRFVKQSSVGGPFTVATVPASEIASPQNLTKVDDTNVTLTLGGTPTGSLLQPVSITAGWTGQLSLARGGTNANLTASNGGLLYSTASAAAILAGTATAGQIPRSGSSSAPSWSTATYPATAAAGTVLAAGTANTIAGTATPTLGVAGSVVGSVAFANATSGNITIQPVTGALGSSVLSLPAVTDQLVTRNSADTFSNKTFDTVNNLLKINGNQLTASAGTATVTMPNTTDTLVGRATTDTLSNKTLAAPNITTGFTIGGTATSGNYARGNGTNFVSSAIQASDLPTVPNTSGSPSASFGAVKVDGTTITATSGVLTAVGSAATAITVGTTTVGSGTSGYLLYNNGGVLGNETIATALGSRATLPTSQTFNSGSGTYTTPANVLWIEVYGWGGGGAGGGAATSTGALAAGAGGGGGGFFYAIINSPAATYSYAVGAGGTAGTAGNNPGNTGGTTTFSTFSAAGGGGGSGSAAGASSMSLSPGAGGVASGATLNYQGNPGTYGFALNGFSIVSGNGGGSGGNGGAAGTSSGSNAGSAPGGGGSGAAGNNAAALQGGVGGAGKILVVEHYGT